MTGRCLASGGMRLRRQGRGRDGRGGGGKGGEEKRREEVEWRWLWWVGGKGRRGEGKGLSSAPGVRNAQAGNTATATNLNTSMTSSWINLPSILLMDGVLMGGGLGFPTQFRGLDHR